MVAASLKQSGLVTDRAYNQLTVNDDTLTRNALKFLWLLVQRSSSSYNLFIEAAQALCNRAMITNGNATKSHVHHDGKISERKNKTVKIGKQQKQPALAKESLENFEKLNLVDGNSENKSSSPQRGLTYLCVFFNFSLLLLFIHLTFFSTVSC